MTKKQTNIDKVLEQAATQQERDDAVAAAHFAPDYVEVKDGVRLYRAKVAHQWAFAIVKADKRYSKILDNPGELVLLVAYMLHYAQDQVRNVVIKEARTGKILDAAWRWIEKEDINPDGISPAVNELFADLAGSGDDAGESPDPGGGAD